MECCSRLLQGTIKTGRTGRGICPYTVSVDKLAWILSPSFAVFILCCMGNFCSFTTQGGFGEWTISILCVSVISPKCFNGCGADCGILTTAGNRRNGEELHTTWHTFGPNPPSCGNCFPRTAVGSVFSFSDGAVGRYSS